MGGRREGRGGQNCPGRGGGVGEIQFGTYRIERKDSDANAYISDSGDKVKADPEAHIDLTTLLSVNNREHTEQLNNRYVY